MYQEDQHAIHSPQKGNAEAFAEVVRHYLPLVFHYLARLTQDTALAEDLTQETFIRAWKHIKTFNTDKLFKPWLMRIARNCALDTLRRQRVVPFAALSPAEYLETEHAFVPGPDLPQQASTTETVQAVRNVLTKLTPSQREMLTLHYLEEFSAPDIAKILGLPLETVRSRLRRARAAFRHLCEPDLVPSLVLDNTGTYDQTTRTQIPAKKLASSPGSP